MYLFGDLVQIDGFPLKRLFHAAMLGDLELGSWAACLGGEMSRSALDANLFHPVNWS
jgi:hypothetical protein